MMVKKENKKGALQWNHVKTNERKIKKGANLIKSSKIKKIEKPIKWATLIKSSKNEKEKVKIKCKKI